MINSIYWYSTNISSSSLAKSLLALSPSPVWATMSNKPSNFFTWITELMPGKLRGALSPQY